MAKAIFSKSILNKLKCETADYEENERLRKRKGRENRVAHQKENPALSYFRSKMKDTLFISIFLTIYLFIQRPDHTDSDIAFTIIYPTFCIFLLRNTIVRFLRKICGQFR